MRSVCLCLSTVLFFCGCAHDQPFLVPGADREAPLKIHLIKSLMSQAYLIESPDGLVLVDTGGPGNASKILGKMKDIGRADLRLILITHGHFDHYGSAGVLRRRTGAPIAVHRADAEAMAEGETRLGEVRSWGRLGKALLPVARLIWRTEGTPADMLVDEGFSLEAFGIQAKILHMPGHTPGSIGLVVEGRYVFAGDLLSSRPRLHPQSYYASDWDQVARSLERLKKMDPSMVFPGHGRPVRGDELEGL